MNKIGFSVGLLMLFIFLLFMGCSSIYQGVRGVFGKKIDLILKEHYVGNSSDITKGPRAYFWGILYVLLGLVFLGAGFSLVFLIINASR